MTGCTIDIEDLRPGVIVLVGLHASGSIGHTFYLQITNVLDHLPDGRIRLDGHRLTPHGRIVEHMTIFIALNALFPFTMN